MPLRPHRALLYALFLTSLLSPVRCFAASQNGWDLLWSNKFQSAEKVFRTKVASNKADAEAWRGLGWTSYFKGDDKSAIDQWCRSVQLAPTAWTSAALWPTVCYLEWTEHDYGPYEAAAKVLASTAGVRPELAWSGRLILAHRTQRTASVGAAKAQISQIGCITNWRVVGPFDNVSKSGFDKIFPPEQTIDVRAVYDGKDDMQLKWRTCPTLSNDGVLDDGIYLSDSDPDIFYAATAVEAPADMDAVIRYDASGASKVYVDGQLLHDNPVYRSPSIDIMDGASFKVHLVRGWNSILVKQADDTSATVDLGLRITDTDGAAVKLTVDPSHCQGQKVDAPSTDTVAPSTDAPMVDDFMEAVTADHRDTAEGAFLLAHYAYCVGAEERAESVLRSAIAKYPSCAALHSELSKVLTVDGQDDESRAERKIARGLTTSIASDEVDYLSDEKSGVDQPAHVKALRALVAKFPNSDDVVFAYATALRTADMNAEGYKVALRAYKKNPGESLLKRLDDYLNGDNDHDHELLPMFATAVKADPMDDDLVERYAAILYRVGNNSASLKEYLAAAAAHPEMNSGIRSAATVCDTMGKTAQAIALHQRLVAARPQDGTVEASLGKEYEQAGRKADAIAAYAESIRLDPTQVDLRDKLQILTGQKPVLDLVQPLSTPNLDKLRGPGADGAPSAVFLVDETREVVYPDYVTQAWAHQVVKINDQAAAKTYQQYGLSEADTASSTATVERAVLLKADGKTEDHTSDAGSTSVDFPSLSPGDIIDVTYRVVDHSSGQLAHDFWTEWYFGMPGTQSKAARLSIITPVDMDYKFVAHGGAPDPTDRVAGKWRVRQWSVMNGPEYKQELLSEPDKDWAPWVDVSTVKSWGDIVRWYEDLSSPRCKPDVAVSAKAVELTKDDKTDTDKLRSLVRYVSHDVQYQTTPFRNSAYVPTEGKQVIRERYGDCKDKAALLTAMLSTLGIKSHMVLLTPRDYGTTPYLPSPRFAHAIAFVDTPDGKKFIDGTADGLPYGSLPWGDQGVQALVIDPGTTDLQTTPFLSESAASLDVNYSGEVIASSTTPAPAKVEVDCNGNIGWGLRNAFNNLTKDQQQQAVRMFCTEFSKLIYSDGSIQGLDDPEKPFVLKFSGTNDSMTDEAGDFLLLTMPWGAGSITSREDSLISTLSAPDRRTDVKLGPKSSAHYHVELKVPAGYLPDALPKPVSETTPWESYSISYSFDAGVLKADMDERVLALKVARGDLAKYIEVIKKHEADLRKKIVLKKQA